MVEREELSRARWIHGLHQSGFVYAWGLLDVSFLSIQWAKMVNTKYFVVGLSDLTAESSVAFLESRSSKPADDVERALALDCVYVMVRLLDGEEAEGELSRYIELLRFQGVKNKVSELSSPRRLKGGTLTYSVIGLGPDKSMVSPETGGSLHKANFVRQVSVTPSYDVKEALCTGSVSVRVAVNYEQTEDERLEEEEDRQRMAELEEDGGTTQGRTHQGVATWRDINMSSSASRGAPTGNRTLAII